jgi:hypothetical protein
MEALENLRRPTKNRSEINFKTDPLKGEKVTKIKRMRMLKSYHEHSQ